MNWLNILKYYNINYLLDVHICIMQALLDQYHVERIIITGQIKSNSNGMPMSLLNFLIGSF